MKNLLLLLFIVSCLKSFTQTDTIFYGQKHDTVASLSLATRYETVTRSAASPNEELRRKYTKEGQLIAEDYYYINRGAARLPESKDKERNGTSRMWYNSGKLKREIVFKNDKMNGTCKTYWENGQLKRDDIYEDGKLVSGKCYTSTGKNTPHYNLEIMPEFIGGVGEMMKYVQQNVHYPEKSKKNNIKGKVFVKFVVEVNGSISSVEILKGVNEEIDAEALRVVQSMPNWNPGFDDGTPIRVYFNLPIVFRLNK
jgi:TonB family protein